MASIVSSCPQSQRQFCPRPDGLQFNPGGCLRCSSALALITKLAHRVNVDILIDCTFVNFYTSFLYGFSQLKIAQRDSASRPTRPGTQSKPEEYIFDLL